MRREIAVRELRRRDADQRDGRAVMQVQDGIAAIICGGCHDRVRVVGGAIQRGPVPDGLIEGGNRVVAACCHAIVPEGLVAAGKADQGGVASRRALHRISVPPQTVVLPMPATIDSLPAVASKKVFAAPPRIVSPDTPPIVSLPPLPPVIVSVAAPQIVSLPPVPPRIDW